MGNVTGGIKICSNEEFDVTKAAALFTCNERLKKTLIVGNQYSTQQVE